MGLGPSGHPWDVAEAEWAKRWLQARDELGLHDIGTNKHLICPIGPDGLPTPNVIVDSQEIRAHI